MIPKILWPPTLALMNPVARTAYQLRFLKEAFVTERVQIEPMPIPQGLLGLVHTYMSSVTDAHYLPRVFARPLEGRKLPKGILTVRIDGETIVTGKLASFLPESEPLDCLKTYRWRKTNDLPQACAMIGSSVSREHQIGFMAINQTKVQV